MRRAYLIAGCALAVLVGGAGWSLAQDNTTAAPPAPAPSTDGNAVTTAAPTPLDIPPAEDAPSEEADAPPPPAQSPPANTVASAPEAEPAAPVGPPKRPHYPAVVLQALDKVTAETLRFEARIDEPVRYKDLVITVHACETQASDEPYTQTAAHLEVQYQPDSLGHASTTAREVFRGWMFADSPGLHPFEHPIYDVWVIACRTPPAPAPAASSASSPVPRASL